MAFNIMEEKKEEKKKDEHKLTPHTLRLIKLVTSGSYSSTASDHVKYAISLLSNIASQSSPFVLWDILARLYSSLTCNERGNEGTKFDDDSIITKREHIALAMEYVAKYIPPSDRRHFLMDSSIFVASSKSKNDSGNSSISSGGGDDDDEHMCWLKVQDFLQNTTDDDGYIEKQTTSTSSLDQILQHGRLLLSSNGLQYENDDENDDYEKERSILSSLDTSTITSSSATEQRKLLKKRIKIQRQILARRLGLGSIDGILKSDDGIGMNDLITDEDLVLDRNVDIVSSSDKDVPKVSARERNMKRIQKRIQNDSSIATKSSSKRQKIDIEHSSSTQTDKNDKGSNIDNKDDGDGNYDDDGEKSTIRNILLLSLNQHPNSSLSASNSRHQPQSDPSFISHQNPQTVLATDMIYNSFHPSWHVRHGSLLGLLALLKAWRNGLSTPDKSSKSIVHFGSWPEDIVCRCLCILALDRFGDFAGAALEAVSNHDNNHNELDSYNQENDTVYHFDGKIRGSAYSAPVRETAARVLSMLLSMAPRETIQKPCYQILVQLASYNQEWEVRHGSMLAFKYVANLMSQEYQLDDNDQRYLDHSIWNEVANNAISGLNDQYDDVKGAAAQVLYCFVERCDVSKENEMKIITNLIASCAMQIWQALNEVDNTSSCTLDLLILFSKIVATDCQLVLQSIGVFKSNKSLYMIERLLMKMCDFLDFDDYSVRLSCFYTLSVVAGPIAKALTHCKDECCGTMELYCTLLRKLFNSYFYNCNEIEGSYEVDDKGKGISETPARNILMFKSARKNTWSAVVDAARLSLKGEVSIIRKTFMSMLFRLIDPSRGLMKATHNSSVNDSLRNYTSTLFECVNSACQALVELYKKMELSSIVDLPLTAFILCLLESPWTEVCECSCILLKSLVSSRTNDMTCFMSSECKLVLDNILINNPVCVAMDNYPNRDTALEDKPTRDLCRKVLITTLVAEIDEFKSDIEASHWVRTQISQVIDAWSNVFKAFNIHVFKDSNVQIKKSKHQMRICASIAGAYVSLGSNYLPPKLSNVIRALMTSIINEDESRRSETSTQDIAKLIKLLEQSQLLHHGLAVTKIFEKVCTLASKDPAYAQAPSESLNSHSWKASQRILYLVVKSIPQNDDLSKLTVLWRFIKCLQTSDPALIDVDHLKIAITIFSGLSSAFQKQSKAHGQVISSVLPTLVLLACVHNTTYVREKAVDSIISTCLIDPEQSVSVVLPYLLKSLDASCDDACRLGACILMNTLVEQLGVLMIPYVSCLLPVSMSSMTDPIERCAKLAAATFAYLVRLAPLVQTEQDYYDSSLNSKKGDAHEARDKSFKQVVDHLIHGKALPPFPLPENLLTSLSNSNISLRHYQEEGISWLCLLRTLKLNGALCDDMGLVSLQNASTIKA